MIKVTLVLVWIIFSTHLCLAGLGPNDFVMNKTYIQLCDTDTAELISELEIIAKNDQGFRFEIGRLTSKHGPKSIEVQHLWDKQHKLDSINQSKISAIINCYGYPGNSLVGEDLQNVALFVIQHAALEMQETYFPIIFEAAKNGELDNMPVLMLMDRIHMRKFGKQIFRSQSLWNKDLNKFEPVPVDSTVNADSIRLLLGIISPANRK